MSEQEKRPVCALCGNAPVEASDNGYVLCNDVDCEMFGAWLTEDAWRRLMARPRLAPKHVEELRWLLRGATGGAVTLYPLEFDAIRAALAALGEDNRHE